MIKGLDVTDLKEYRQWSNFLGAYKGHRRGVRARAAGKWPPRGRLVAAEVHQSQKAFQIW